MTELFERTHDAMVAFELAKLHEKAGANDEAVRWYTTACERFRRESWRSKAAEALARLGAPVPTTSSVEISASAATAGEEETTTATAVATTAENDSQLHFASSLFADAPHPQEPAESAPAGEHSAAALSTGEPGHKRKRRGRRGGRGRRKRGQGLPDSVMAAPQAEVAAPRTPAPRSEPRRAEPRHHEPPLAREVEPGPISIAAAMAARSKAGDPGLASRSAQLESQLRRLLADAPHGAPDYEEAPAGPGVLLLSDSDLMTYYYVEKCETLRVAMRMIVQGARGRERGESVRARLAEHLTISETKVAKYVKEHCVFRWLQLDEGASHLAHFAIAVLRPALND